MRRRTSNILPDSDEESEPEQTTASVPSNKIIEKALRDAVADVFKTGRFEELTVRRIRVQAEKSLSLDEGLLKNDELWKEKSSHIIKEEVVR